MIVPLYPANIGKRRQIGRALLAGIVVGLLAEISINPFGTAFRFSLGPVALAFFALFFTLPAYLTGAAAGLMVPLVHGAFAWYHAHHHSLSEVVTSVRNYFPETLAYSLMGLLFWAFRVSERTRSPFQLAALLAAADFSTNAIELVVRTEPFSFRAVVMMGVVAFGRAMVAAGAYYILQEGVRERQWQEERRSYMQRLFFASNLQTEAFFLQKSAGEMEAIMAKAHRLYRDLTGHPEQPLALEIAKDIHEIKKDYQRTLAALNQLVDQPKLEPEMNLAEVVDLVFDANRSYAQKLNKRIDLIAELGADFRTPRFGRWVSILNNLVSNAIEASRYEGSVTVRTACQSSHFVLWVDDTGTGIPEEDWELVFSPGFSTKLNPVTGDFSSGIGLTHVASLIRSMAGTIEIESSGPAGTTFRMEVPWSQLDATQQGG